MPFTEIFIQKEIGFCLRLCGCNVANVATKNLTTLLYIRETHSIKEFVNITARYLGFSLTWKGKGLNEYAVEKKSGKISSN